MASVENVESRKRGLSEIAVGTGTDVGAATEPLMLPLKCVCVPKLSLMDMPLEIIEKIVTAPQVSTRSVRSVCRAIREIVQPILVHKFEIDSNCCVETTRDTNDNPTTVVSILPTRNKISEIFHARDIGHLELVEKAYEKWSGTLYYRFRDFTNLHTLKIYNFQHDQIDIDFKTLTRLRTLDISLSNKALLSNFNDSLHMLTALESLLCANVGLPLTKLHTLSSLTRLNISINKWDIHASEPFTCPPQLNDLRINFLDIDVPSPTNIIIPFRSVKKLILYKCQSNDFEFLTGFKSLVELQLINYNKHSRSDFCLPVLRALRIVTLTGCVELYNLLARNPWVEQLDTLARYYDEASTVIIHQTGDQLRRLSLACYSDRLIFFPNVPCFSKLTECTFIGVSIDQFFNDTSVLFPQLHTLRCSDTDLSRIKPASFPVLQIMEVIHSHKFDINCLLSMQTLVCVMVCACNMDHFVRNMAGWSGLFSDRVRRFFFIIHGTGKYETDVMYPRNIRVPRPETEIMNITIYTCARAPPSIPFGARG